MYDRYWIEQEVGEEMQSCLYEKRLGAAKTCTNYVLNQRIHKARSGSFLFSRLQGVGDDIAELQKRDAGDPSPLWVQLSRAKARNMI